MVAGVGADPDEMPTLRQPAMPGVVAPGVPFRRAVVQVAHAAANTDGIAPRPAVAEAEGRPSDAAGKGVVVKFWLIHDLLLKQDRAR